MSQDPSSRVASWLTPAGDSRTPDGSKILALFREWTEARRRSGRNDNDSDADRANLIESEITNIPAVGATGLVVKMYLYLCKDDDNYRIDRAALAGCEPSDLEYWDVSLKRSILQDMISAVPELAPLAADFINAEPSQPWITALMPSCKASGLGYEETNRRCRIVSEECRLRLEEIWPVRPVTNADHRKVVCQVIVRHPDWFDPEKLSKFSLLEEDVRAELLLGSGDLDEDREVEREHLDEDRSAIPDGREQAIRRAVAPSEPHVPFAKTAGVVERIRALQVEWNSPLTSRTRRMDILGALNEVVHPSDQTALVLSQGERKMILHLRGLCWEKPQGKPDR